MGAVFAIFAGFYYWVEKILGIKYNEVLTQIHFITFFFAVNITFFPMHFLGLAGMPRRIGDYPDAYTFWNRIASSGSLLSLYSTIFFFYIIFDMFNCQVLIKNYNTIRTYDRFKLNTIFIKNDCIRFNYAPISWLFARTLGWGEFNKKSLRSPQWLNFFFLFDLPIPNQLMFQDPASFRMRSIIDLHDDIMFFLIIIVAFVLWMVMQIIWQFSTNTLVLVTNNKKVEW
jgi:hypothetical protein